VKLGRGPSKIWPALYRLGLARARLPFWRVVVEAKLGASMRLARKHGFAVTAVFVWARTIEEAEGLASLALEEEGLEVQTADAKQCPPAAAPKNVPAAVSRTELAFLPRIDGETGASGPSRRGARA